VRLVGGIFSWGQPIGKCKRLTGTNEVLACPYTMILFDKLRP